VASDLSVGGRATAAVLVALAMAGLLAGVLDGTSAGAAAFGVISASIAIGVVPGALVILAWRPGSDFTLLELLGAGIAVSFGLVQLMTMLMMTVHRSSLDALFILGVVAIGHAVVVARTPGVSVRLPRHQLWLGLAIAAVAGCLYMVGAPYDSTEDAIHVALVRRLTFLANPTLRSIYFIPDFVYTYPFPGTHYFMALVSRASDLDPLFVYHKLRVFWGAAALVLLYSCARRLFQSERLAMASALVATGLTANGSFGVVPHYYWGQLAPFSHASDVAMAVLLPALLLGALWTMQASTRRELMMAAATAGGMLLMLVIVHVREVVQFATYLLAFALVLIATRRDRVVLRRTLALLVATICLTAGYTSWNASVAGTVGTLVAQQRASLVALVQQMSLSDVMSSGAALLGGYMPGFAMFFYGWNPIVLLIGGVVLWLLRDRTFALLIAASILWYAVIVRFIPLTVAYVYATYFEILFTPVRNVIFFVHLLAGVTLYVAATAMASRTRWVAALLTSGAAGAIATAYVWLGHTMTTYNDLLWLPLFLTYGGTALYVTFRSRQSSALVLDATTSSGAWAVMLVLFASMVWVSWNSEAGSAAAWREPSIGTPRALFSSPLCVEHQDYELPDLPPGTGEISIGRLRSCRPSAQLVEFARDALPVDAVLAVDRFDEFSPSTYLPQQMDVWPGMGDGLLDRRALFAGFYKYYDLAVARYGDQPFFNTRETRAERVAFLAGLGITHVLVNPRNHATLVPLLDADPELFQQRYDDGEWAIYDVLR
jgi:hypothetical protein